MELNVAHAKRNLFSHADPSLAIREMKSMKSHLTQTRDLLSQSLDMMGNIKVGVSNASNNLSKTSNMYEEYEEKLKKTDLYVKGLKRK